MLNTFSLLSKIFGGLGCAFILVAITMALIRMVKLLNYVTGRGTVVDFHRTGRLYRPVVEFTPSGHSPIKFKSVIGANPPAFHKGEFVPVLYSPTAPSNAFIDRFWQLWFFPTLFGIIGAPFLMIGVIIWIWKIG